MRDEEIIDTKRGALGGQLIEHHYHVDEMGADMELFKFISLMTEYSSDLFNSCK